MAEVKKFLDFTGLSRYHTNIKGYIDGNVGNISNLTTTAKSNVVVALNEVNALAKGAAKALVVNSYSALISTLSSASKGDYLIGQHFYVKTIDVPDVWISGINNNSTTYTYVSESKVEEDLESNNLVVGYFQLSPLEGQKIDLSDYATTSDLSDLDDRKLDKDVEIVISAAINDLESRKLDKDTFIINITYSDLKNLRDNDQLVKGQQYRITDFVTTTTQENTQSAGHAFDIIVMADDVNILNENARAIKHSGDTYFADSKLEAWELKYCIDNDTTRFAWADDANGKGVIYYMKDEFENECPYDFKNIQFKRYQLKNQNSLHIADYPMGESDYSGATQMAFNIWKEKLGTSMSSNNVAFYYTKGVYSDGYLVNGAEIYDYSNDYESYDNGNLMFDETTSEGNYIGVVSVYDHFDVIAEVENTNGEWFYTFSKKATTSATATDASMDTDCYENFIKEYFNNGIQTLNDNIFIVVSNSIVVYGNSFDTNCYNNTFGNYCGSNTFGNDCYYNTFGNGCGSNTFGNNCYSNSFGNSCYRNTFGNDCYYNTFGNYFRYNSFGNYCYNNSFGNYFQYNSFGNYFYNNSFGNYFRYNSFGNYFQYNSFGNNCYYNTFGNGCNNITFAKDYMYYNIVENGNQYITVTSTQTTSGSNVIRNITIAQGVNNSTTSKTISHDTVNDTFKTTYQNSNSTIVNV